MLPIDHAINDAFFAIEKLTGKEFPYVQRQAILTVLSDLVAKTVQSRNPETRTR